jgi:hypothetical protein
MSIDMYNDDDLISGENIFKKAVKNIKRGIKKAYKSGSSISIDKSGVNVVDKPQIIVDSNFGAKSNFIDSIGKDTLKTSLLVGVGLIALLVFTGKKKE